MCEAHDRLVYMATHDHMTGLLNREAFLRAAQSCRTRSGGNFLLIVDADHFKAINDRHGHSGGDEALVKIANALRYSVREKDIVGRIGGEEFAILLGSVDQDEAERMAEFIRRQVRFIPWKGAGDPGLSVSIGGAILRPASGQGFRSDARGRPMPLRGQAAGARPCHVRTCRVAGGLCRRRKLDARRHPTQSDPHTQRRENSAIDAADKARPTGAMAKISLKLDELIDGDALAPRPDCADGGDERRRLRPGRPRRRSPAAQGAARRRPAASPKRMLMEDGGGTACAARLSHLMDEMIRALYDFAVDPCLPREEPVRGRAHGRGRGRRLRPRHAGAGLRHRPAVPAALQADAVGRADRRIHALHAVGHGPEGRPRHPQHRRMPAPVAHRHHHPHRDPRGALPVGRRRRCSTS